MAADVVRYCKSCSNCQLNIRAGPRKASMVQREIAVVPFENVAIDLVSPFEKGRGGARYLLTYICMAPKWPEAVPFQVHDCYSCC